MVMYATAAELAGYLQQDDIDTYSAEQALTLASAEFTAAADTFFTSTSETYVTTGTRSSAIWLPFNHVTAVDEVRMNGVTVVGWLLIGNRLFFPSGFGGYYSPGTPTLLEVDVVHGYPTPPDDVKYAVLDMAGALYDNPTGAMTESIDDYTVRYDTSGQARSSHSWRDVAMRYRGTVMA